MIQITRILCTIIVGVTFFGCLDNEIRSENNSNQEGNVVFRLESGAVTTDGKQMIFDNSKVYSVYKMKIQQDSSFRRHLEENYNFLLIKESQNSSYDKKYLFGNLSLADFYCLNRNGVMIIEEHATRFDSIHQYMVPVAKATLLNFPDVNDPAVVKNKYHESIRTFNARLSNLNGKDARYQQEYTLPNGQKRKFIHEIFTNKIALPNGGLRHELLLNHKHEYKSGSGYWYLSSEARDVSWNVNFDGFFAKNNIVYNIFPGPGTSSGSVIGATYQVAVVLHYFDTAYDFSSSYWNIEVRGRVQSTNTYANMIDWAPCPFCPPSALW